MLDSLATSTTLFVKQQFEWAELLDFETRNKYRVFDERDESIAFAAEQSKGVLGVLGRQFLGHWRTFDIHIFDAQRRHRFTAKHPFRWIFRCLEVIADDGQRLGTVQHRFALFSKRFDILDSQGRTLFAVRSPFWRFWTFRFEREGQERAVIEKRWTGLGAEFFTDKDTFRLQFKDPGLSLDTRVLLLSAALFVDLIYFERKGNG